MIEQQNQDMRYQELEMRIPLTIHIKDGEETLVVEGKLHVPVYWGDGEWMDRLHGMLSVFKQVITLYTKEDEDEW